MLSLRHRRPPEGGGESESLMEKPRSAVWTPVPVASSRSGLELWIPKRADMSGMMNEEEQEEMKWESS